MPADFSGCLARLDWASKATYALDAEIGRWVLENDPAKVTIEYHPEADIHTFRLSGQVPPQRFWILMGNIVHQVRAVLDNLVWQLVIANGNKPSGRFPGNSFPMQLRDNPNVSFADRTASALRGVHPHHVALIERLQPYKRPSGRRPADQHPLGILRHLSNRDKHHIVQVLAARQHPSRKWHWAASGGFTSTVESEMFELGELKPGTIIGWARFLPTGFHPDMHMQLSVWIHFVTKDPPNPGGDEFTFWITDELHMIVANVRAVIESFLPVATGGKAKPVSFKIEAIKDRYQAHLRARPAP